MATQIPFKELAKRFEDKLKNIKVAAFDIDGVLTTGHVHYTGKEMGWNRFFHTSDGYGMKLLMQMGIKVGVISGGDSKGVHERFINNLQIDFAHVGNEDKRDAFNKVLDLGFEPSEVLYMGDEFFDMPLLRRAGFSATTPIASLEVQEIVDYVTIREPGMGAVREIVDIMRMQRGFVPTIADF